MEYELMYISEMFRIDIMDHVLMDKRSSLDRGVLSIFDTIFSSHGNIVMHRFVKVGRSGALHNHHSHNHHSHNHHSQNFN